MTEAEKRKVLLRAMQLFGLSDPLAQLAEASAELIIAVQHVQQKREGYIDAIAGRVADVELLLDQLKMTAQALAERVDVEKAFKLDQLKKAVEAGRT